MVTVEQHRGTTVSVDVASAGAFYRHGWHSWSPTGWVNPNDPVRPIADEGRRLGHDDPVHAFDTTVSGSGVGAVTHTDGTATLVGALAPGGRVWPDGTTLRGSTEGDPIDWVVVRGDELHVFRAYADRLAAAFGRRGGDRVRVWCSWYSFYENVSAAAIDDVVTSLSGVPFDFVQVDDGWEQAIGDWEPNAKFPLGMGVVADCIRQAGFTPGLWLAPLIARSTSRLVADRPELLLRDGDGDPVVAGINWGGPYFALDTTSQATLEFVSELIARSRSWGYEYLKLDFLYAGAFPGVPRNDVPREVAYRNACEVMRRTAGDDCYLLACGAPILPSLGIFDGIRVGPDVDEVWEVPGLAALGDESGRGARNALATSVDRLWLRNVIDVDPDCVYLKHDTELDDRTRGALKDLARVSRFIGLADPPAALDDVALAELHTLLTDDPPIVQRDRYVWEIGSRTVDFSWVRNARHLSASQRGKR